VADDGGPADTAPDAAASPYLTVREAAAYLHLNEKTLYTLIQEGTVPATKVTGKWLFARALLDEWLLESMHGGVLADRLLIAGSDDPWLAHSIARLAQRAPDGALIAYSPCGTRRGLALLAQRRANACPMHWGDAHHAPRRHALLLREYSGSSGWVMVQLALREQGVMLSRRLEPVDSLANLLARTPALIQRGAGAGSQHFFAQACLAAGVAMPKAGLTAATEREAAFLVADGAGDCAPGTRAAAGEFGLHFLPLGSEAFDLVMPRTLYFRALLQQLLAELASDDSRDLATRLGGYDLAPLGRLRAEAAAGQ
jgi:putative molybdopterin biosynthesis protein